MYVICMCMYIATYQSCKCLSMIMQHEFYPDHCMPDDKNVKSLFDWMLYIPVNNYVHVGTSPLILWDFYPTLR